MRTLGCFLNVVAVLGVLQTGTIFDNTALIPRIDLRQPRDAVVQAVQRAADVGGPGFFYLMGHGIPEEMFDNVIREAHKFYTMPSRKKLEISAVGYGGGDTATKGYIPPFSEGSYAKDASDVRPPEEEATEKRNTRESLTFRYPESQHLNGSKYLHDYPQFLRELDSPGTVSVSGPELRFSHPDNRVADPEEVAAAAGRFFLENQWPAHDELPGFRAIVEGYFNEMRKLAATMFDLFSRAMVMPTTSASQTSSGQGASRLQMRNESLQPIKRDRSMVSFNLARYPPTRDNASMGIADHTDWEAFTLLYPTYLQNKHLEACRGGANLDQRLAAKGCPELGKPNPNFDPETGIAYTGLEVWFQNQWVKVPRIPGAILVNQGEMLSRLSGGRFKPPVHRVQAQNEFERYSLVSFWAPNYEMLLPDPDLPYGKVLAGEHYARRNNFVTPRHAVVEV